MNAGLGVGDRNLLLQIGISAQVDHVLEALGFEVFGRLATSASCRAIEVVSLVFVKCRSRLFEISIAPIQMPRQFVVTRIPFFDGPDVNQDPRLFLEELLHIYGFALGLKTCIVAAGKTEEHCQYGENESYKVLHDI